MTSEHDKETAYSYKPSMAGAPMTFRLTDEGLAIQAGYRSLVWRYADIARIRLTYRPVSMLAHRFRADISNAQGKRMKIVSASWNGIVTLAPQDEAYRLFIRELHASLMRSGARTSFVAGLHPILFAVGVFLTGVVAVALLGLLIRALLTANFVAALFMIGFAGWYGWYTVGGLLRNKPRSYSPQEIPKTLLP